ncbi:S1-C subfamily serine protease [Paenibacillus phyllosphaerae]|uniref:S1-C subfamily serine protease n=1 Tax=Paenibacillus phyllosphaerae TaxID=274593 RepID=A0A7W5AY09_9BACL|nr:trypsin-like peptidase domain-containing protein [Paenibacillus phyllosphaerae]MBB3110855.1 S1-C subfamily serine protease [Paenibacillus phyllosphaerae]
MVHPYRIQPMRRMLLRLIILLLTFAFMTVAYGQQAAAADADQGPMDPRVLADTNKPGVVMIATLYKASISIPQVIMSQEALAQLQDKLARDIVNGKLANDPNAIIDAIFQDIFKDPLKYLLPTKTVTTQEVQAGATGTGFIITPDGYILTNAHVVYTPEDQLKELLIMTGLQELIEQDVTAFINEVNAANYEPTEETLQQLREAAATFYIQYATLSGITTQVYTEMGVAIPGVQVMQKGFVSEVKKRGEVSPGKDVAILKIDSDNLPTVPLGDDGSLRTGDQIFVIGYPGAATFNPMLADESVLESTLTSGLISARKTMPGGWDIMQVDAAMTHGNSGGPVFNEQGDVIGIATFGSIDSSNGAEVQGMNFVIPVSIAKQFLNELNVTPTESQLTTLYKEGLTFFNEGKYSKALDKFREVNELNPGYPYIQTFISDSRMAVNNEPDTGLNWTLILLIAGGVLLLIILVLVIILLLRKFNFKVERRPNPAPTPPSPPPQPAVEPAAAKPAEPQAESAAQQSPDSDKKES